MNRETYNKIFVEILEIDESVLPGLEYQSVPNWDSVGHMELLAELESAFDVSLELDDIIDLSSYEKGIEILRKYGVEI